MERLNAMAIRNALVWPFVYGVSLAGLATIGASAVRAVDLPQSQLLEVGLFFVLCAIAQVMPVPLFRNSSMSVNFAIAIAAMVYLGPAAGVIANIGGGLVMGFRPRRKPFHKALYNVAQLALATGLAGIIYVTLGGQIRPTSFEWSNVGPAVVAITAYFFVNTGLLAAAIAMTGNATLTSVWGLNYRWLAPNFVGLGLVGFGMASAVAAVGLLGLSIFLIPLVMAWYSFKLYMAKTEEVRHRNDELRLTNAQLDVANARLTQRVTELSALNRIGLSMNGSLDLADVLGEILDSSMRLVPGQGAAVALADPNSGRIRVANAVGFSTEAAAALQAYDGPMVRAFETDSVVAIADTVEAGEGTLANEDIRAILAVPLHFGGRVGGVFVVSYATVRDFGADEVLLLSTLAQQASTAVHNARLYQEIEQSYLSTIQAMVTAVEGREQYAPGHADRIRSYAIATATALGLEQRQTATLETAAMFHDIGHIGVPETVLSKAGELTTSEWETVRKHPMLGASILKQVPRMEAVVPVILQHHERFDGQGYPNGTLGNDINPLAQILAVADAFEAMTNARPHRPAMSVEAALAEIQQSAGTQFAPRVAEAFVKAMARETVKVGAREPALVGASAPANRARR